VERPTGLRGPERRQPWRTATGRAATGLDTTTEHLDGWLMRDLPDGGHWMSCSTDAAHQAKHELVQTLSERSGVSYEDVNEFIKQWAYSSNDDDMRSLAIQKEISEMFDIPLSNFTKSKITEVEKIAERFGYKPGDIGGERPKLKPLMESNKQQAILQAMYNHTQSQLQLAGFEEGSTIRLRRGIRLTHKWDEVNDWQTGDVVNITGNALESWSIGRDTASSFSGRYGFVFEMDVPVERVIATARTGFGCLSEGEFVILGSAVPDEALIIGKSGYQAW
jgi:hypothetical protein